LSPILVRPVREQLEHDRVIRLLQAKYKRKFDVAINPGNEQSAPVGAGPSAWYPDLVLHSTERNRKLLGVVEVETVESINHLEAMSQWAAFARLKAPFHLYVPAAMVDVARRFCTDLQITVTEIWAYHSIGDQIRFTAIQRAPGFDDGMISSREPRRPKPVAAPPKPVVKAKTAKLVAKPASKPPAVKPARRPVPPVRKKAARVAAPVKPPARAAVKKPAPRATKRR
jgi:hypothetical protein